MAQEPRRMLAPWMVEEGERTFVVLTANGFVVSVTISAIGPSEGFNLRKRKRGGSRWPSAGCRNCSGRRRSPAQTLERRVTATIESSVYCGVCVMRRSPSIVPQDDDLISTLCWMISADWGEAGARPMMSKPTGRRS
jgi:hypothetical protein